MQTEFRDALGSDLDNGIYHFNNNLVMPKIKEVAEEKGYVFYYIDGRSVSDIPSFYVALTQSLAFPTYAGSNLDAIFDILTEPRYYDPQKKGILMFDNCQHMANSNPREFLQIFELLRDIPLRFIEYLDHPSMKDTRYEIYVLLRGSENPYKVLSSKINPIKNFIV